MSAIGLFFALLTSAANSQEHTVEKAVLNKLHDVQALISAGVDIDEYSYQIDELVMLEDRYERAKGKSSALPNIVGRLVDARNIWHEKRDASPERQELLQDRVNINIEIAYILLMGFERPKKGKQAD